MNQNNNFWKIMNLFWIVITFIPFFNGLGFIYAGWRVNETKWIDEGIIYMIPFIFLSFTIMNDIIIYSALLLLIIGIIRAFMISKPFLEKLEQNNNNINEKSFNKDAVIINNDLTNVHSFNEKIDINNATLEEIQNIPILNNYRINKIIELRKRGYTFNSLYDLSQKLSLNQSEMEEIGKYIKINKISNSRKIDL